MEDRIYAAIEAVAAICELAIPPEPRAFIAIGGSEVEHPFTCHVAELPENLSVSDLASSTVAMGTSRAKGCYRVEFSVPVTMWAARADLVGTSRIITGWWERIARAVAADRTLGGACEHAKPYYSAGYTNRNADSGTYLVAVQGGVSVAMTINPLE